MPLPTSMPSSAHDRRRQAGRAWDCSRSLSRQTPFCLGGASCAESQHLSRRYRMGQGGPRACTCQRYCCD